MVNKLYVYIGSLQTGSILKTALIFYVTVHVAFKAFNPMPLFLIDDHVKGMFKLQFIVSFQEPVQITTGGVDKNPFESDIIRGPNKPPKKGTVQQIQLNQKDAKYFCESTVGSSRPYDTCADSYSHNACHSHAGTTTSQKTVPTGSGLLFNYRALAGDDCERDNSHAVAVQSVNKTDASLCQNNLINYNDLHKSSNQKNPTPGCDTVNFKTGSMNAGHDQALKGTVPVMTRDNMEVPKPHTVENSFTPTASYADCYLKPSYPVLVGNTVRTYNTKLFASLPQQNKYMVKHRVQDASGASKIKLILKSSNVCNERLTI